VNHAVAFTVAPVVTVFDDQGEIIQIMTLPLALVFFLPCALWRFLTGLRLLAADFRRALRVPEGVRWLPGYLAGWRADLDLMRLAVLDLLFPRGNWGIP